MTKKVYIEIGYKIYCSEHKYNRDITCKKCNKAFNYNCRADASEGLKKNLLKELENEKSIITISY